MVTIWPDVDLCKARNHLFFLVLHSFFSGKLLRRELCKSFFVSFFPLNIPLHLLLWQSLSSATTGIQMLHFFAQSLAKNERLIILVNTSNYNSYTLCRNNFCNAYRFKSKFYRRFLFRKVKRLSDG